MNTSPPQTELQARMAVIEPLLNAVAIFIMATMFLFWDASRAVFVLLSFAALAFLVKYRPEMPRDHRLYSWPIIGYVGATFLSLLFDGMSDSGINRFVSRYLFLLLGIPLVSVFYLSFDSARNYWIKYIAGCLAMGILAMVDILLLGESRAGGGHNEASFGFIALAMTSIVIASYHSFSQIRFGKIIFFLAILMGVCAMILSGTRSSWLGGVVVLVIAMFFYLEKYSLFKRALFALALIGCIVVVGSSVPLAQKRFDQMIEIVTPYAKGEEQVKFNSLRYRVEIWKAGWHLGMENKVFGFGLGNTKSAIREYARQNPGMKRLRKMNHIHNQFMQTFAMSGLVGLVSFLALVICHMWIFSKYLAKRYSQEVRSFAFAGFLLLISYLVMSIPGVPFYGKKYLMMYAFSSASIWGCLLGALQHSQQTENRARVID